MDLKGIEQLLGFGIVCEFLPTGEFSCYNQKKFPLQSLLGFFFVTSLWLASTDTGNGVAILQLCPAQLRDWISN